MVIGLGPMKVMGGGCSMLFALEHTTKASVWTSAENRTSLGTNMVAKIFPILGSKTGGWGTASSTFFKEVLRLGQRRSCVSPREEG